MVKKMMIVLLLFSTAVSAMKRAEPEQAQCFFTWLPLELLNKIARYLDFCETDEECIARVKNQTAVSAEHMNQLEKHMKSAISTSLPPKPDAPIATYSIDQSKIVFLQKRDIYCCIPASFGIVDIQSDTLVKNKFTESVAYHQYLQNKSGDVSAIALSFDGSMLAEARTVKASGWGRNIERMFYEDELVVKISPTHQKRFTLSETSNHNEYKIGFNKQNTKIAALATKKVWNQEKKQIEEREDNQLLPLVSEEEHTARSICTLPTYFRWHMICKDLQAQTKV